MALSPADDTFDSTRRALWGGVILLLVGLALLIGLAIVANSAAIRSRSHFLPLQILNTIQIGWTGYALAQGVLRSPYFPLNARDALIVNLVQFFFFFHSYDSVIGAVLCVLGLLYLEQARPRLEEVYGPTPVAAPGPISLIRRPADWVRANLLNSALNTALTVVAVDLLVATIPSLVDWGLVDSVWSAPNGPACRAAAGGDEPGACWACIIEKARFIVFGRFPYAEQWRPLLVVAVFIALILAS